MHHVADADVRNSDTDSTTNHIGPARPPAPLPRLPRTFSRKAWYWRHQTLHPRTKYLPATQRHRFRSRRQQTVDQPEDENLRSRTRSTVGRLSSRATRFMFTVRDSAHAQVVSLAASEQRLGKVGPATHRRSTRRRLFEIASGPRQNVQAGDQMSKSAAGRRAHQAGRRRLGVTGPRFQNAFKVYENLAIVGGSCGVTLLACGSNAAVAWWVAPPGRACHSHRAAHGQREVRQKQFEFAAGPCEITANKGRLGVLRQAGRGNRLHDPLRQRQGIGNVAILDV